MENQWQPIETAPKDGSKFLMFITGIEYKKFNSDKKYRAKTIQKVLIANYNLENGDFDATNDLLFCVEINEFNFKGKDGFDGVPITETDFQATHWMPLPKPPVINNLTKK